MSERLKAHLAGSSSDSSPELAVSVIPAKRGIATVALVVFLSGCATVSDLRNVPPTAVLSGMKPVADIAACITAGWMELATSLSPADVRALPRPSNGTTVLLNNPATNAPVAFADIDRNGNVTKITYYRQGTFNVNGYFARVDTAVQRCAQ